MARGGDVRGVGDERSGSTEDRDLAADERELGHDGGLERRDTPQDRRVAVDRDRQDLRVRQIQRRPRPVGRNAVEPVTAVVPAHRQDPAVGQERVLGVAEDPVRGAELDLHRRDRLDSPAVIAEQVHPAVRLGDEVEDAGG